MKHTVLPDFLLTFFMRDFLLMLMLNGKSTKIHRNHEEQNHDEHTFIKGTYIIQDKIIAGKTYGQPVFRDNLNIS